MLETKDILTNPRQPRKTFDKLKLDELSSSIREQGVTSPILVRKKGDKYEIIAGERRFRASKIAGLSKVPVIIKDYSDEQSLEIAIVENLQREDLNPVEEALAYKALSSEFGLKQEDIAKRIGKDRSTVSNTMRLLELPQEILDMISDGKMSAGHARPLLALPDRQTQIDTAKEIVKNDLSVRDVEALLQTIDGQPQEKQKKKKAAVKDPVIADISEKLMEKLGTKVDVAGTESKGKVQIYYYTREDLERILESIR